MTFNPNGGSVSLTTATVTYDSTYGTLPTPTRGGYTFAGWYTAASGGTQVTSSTKVTTASNHSIYAHWSARTYYVSTGGNQIFTVKSSGKFGQALSISWAEKNTAQYKYTMSKITIYGGTGKTGPVLKTFTSGSSGTFTMSGTYYSDIYIWADTTQSERIFTVTITSTNSTWTENSSTKMTLDIGAHTSTSLSSNTSKTFQVKYNQEIWMNLALTGFASYQNHVDWSMSPTSLLTVGDNSGANYSGGSFNKGTSSGGYLRTASGSSSTANTWMRWIFKSTASTSDSSSCLTITIHNYKYSSGGGSLCCVDGDSEIAMADGTTKAIKNIKVGDMVLSYDEVNKVLAPTAVERIDVVRRSEILHITFADGTMLKITPDHPMFSERGWVVHDPESAKIAYSDVDIREEIVCIGDMLLSLSLLFDKQITNIEFVTGTFTCYTFKVEENHNYFAQSVLVHNAVVLPCIQPCAIDMCCVDGETDITMADGTTKKAKDIVIGDKIMSYNSKTKMFEETIIKQTITPIRNSIVEITFEDGSILKITNDHPLLTTRGWTAYNLAEANKAYSSLGLSDEELRQGDEVVTTNGTKKIASINTILFEEPEVVYTYELANGDAFIANGNIIASKPSNN